MRPALRRRYRVVQRMPKAWAQKAWTRGFGEKRKGGRMATVNGVSSAQSTTSTRWIQLMLGLVAMMSISSPQYGWAFFTKSLQDSLGVQLSTLQWTFTILIVLQTFLSPIQGYLIDRFGARLLIASGCLLSGLGWIAASYVTSIT